MNQNYNPLQRNALEIVQARKPEQYESMLHNQPQYTNYRYDQFKDYGNLSQRITPDQTIRQQRPQTIFQSAQNNLVNNREFLGQKDKVYDKIATMVNKSNIAQKTPEQIINEFKAYTLPKLRLKRFIKMQAVMKGYYVRRFLIPRIKQKQRVYQLLAEDFLQKVLYDKFIPNIVQEVISNNKERQDLSLYSDKHQVFLRTIDDILNRVVMRMAKEVVKDQTDYIVTSILNQRFKDKPEVEKDPMKLVVFQVIQWFLDKEVYIVAKETIQEQSQNYYLDLQYQKVMREYIIPNTIRTIILEALDEIVIEQYLEKLYQEQIRSLSQPLASKMIQLLEAEQESASLDIALSNYILRMMGDININEYSFLRIEVQMQSLQLICLTSYELTIGYSQSEEKRIEHQKTFDFVLEAQQIDITDIYIKLDPEYEGLIELVDKIYTSPDVQATRMRILKPMKYPSAYYSMIHCLKEAKPIQTQILLRFKFANLVNSEYEYLKGLEDKLNFKVYIAYTIKPIAGLRFLLNHTEEETQRFLITEKHYKSASCWMPVPHPGIQKFPPYSFQEKDLIFYKQIVVITDIDYFAVASGQLEEELVSDNNRGYVYKINDYISPDDIGIFVGQFKYSYQQMEDIKFVILHNNPINHNIFQHEQVKQIYENVDRYWFKDQTLQKVRETFNIPQGQQYLSNMTVIVLPNIYQEKYLSFYPFRNLIIFDELQIPQQSICYHQFNEFQRVLKLQLNYLCLSLFLATSKEVQDRWIQLGFVFQISSIEDHQISHNKLIRQIKIGQDVNLNTPHGFLIESQEYQLKTRHIMSIMNKVTKSGDTFLKEILKRFYQDYKGTIPSPMSNEVIYQNIRKVFVVDCKTQKDMFIQSSGAWEFKLSYKLLTKENKLNIEISQNPLINHWASEYTKHRMIAEQKFDLNSDMFKTYNHNVEQIKLQQEQIQKLKKKKDEEQKLIQDQVVSKKENEHDYSSPKISFIPQELKAPMYFRGKIEIFGLDTNELQSHSQAYDKEIKNEYHQEIQVNYQQKSRKIIIAKRLSEINAQSYLNNDDDGDNIQPPMVHGILGEAHMKSGSLIKKAKELSKSIQNQPKTWIKWDPNGLLVKEVKYEDQNEVTVLCQVMKEKDINQIICIAQNLQSQEQREKVLFLIIEIIETSYAHLDYNIIQQLLELLVNLVNQITKIKLKEDQIKIDNIHELSSYLKLAEKIIYRQFYNQFDNSVKYFKFTNIGDYEIVLSLLKCLRKLKNISKKKSGFNLEIIQLLREILESYDNQFNQYDCTKLIAEIFKLLLNTYCSHDKFKIHIIVLHELKKAVFSQKYPILKVIILNYHNFVKINFSHNDIHPNIKEAFDKYNRKIVKIINNYQEQLNYVDNNYMELVFYKRMLKDTFIKKQRPFIFVLKQMQYLAEQRLQKAHISKIFYNQLTMFTKFLKKHYIKFAHEISNEDYQFEAAKILAITAQECVITGMSLLNNSVYNDFAAIYRVIYYFFPPIDFCKLIRDKQSIFSNALLNFSIDMPWIDSKLRHLEEEAEKLGATSQPRRSRPVPKNPDMDVVERLKKYISKGDMQEKDVIQQVLKIITSYMPNIKAIEDQFRENVQSQAGTTQNQEKSYSELERVRLSMKRRFDGLDNIQTKTLNAIQTYINSGKLKTTEERDKALELFSIAKKFVEQENTKQQAKINKANDKLSQQTFQVVDVSQI
ncbi:hypothetical protein pb186bvf_016820 [Paramecium bursaria]